MYRSPQSVFRSGPRCKTITLLAFIRFPVCTQKRKDVRPAVLLQLQGFCLLLPEKIGTTLCGLLIDGDMHARIVGWLVASAGCSLAVTSYDWNKDVLTTIVSRYQSSALEISKSDRRNDQLVAAHLYTVTSLHILSCRACSI